MSRQSSDNAENLNAVCPRCGTIGRLVEVRLHMRVQKHPGIRGVEKWARENAERDARPSETEQGA